MPKVYAAYILCRRITNKSAIFHQMGLWFRGIIPASHYNSDLRGVPGSIPGGSILFCFCFFFASYIRSIIYLRFILLIFVLCRWYWNLCYIDIIITYVFFRSVRVLWVLYKIHMDI